MAKHLSLEDRNLIAQHLNEGCSFKAIAKELGKIFEKLYLKLRPDNFTTLMPILLGDNGSKFSDPRALELNRQGNLRTHVFYCDASAPYQKGSAERNHEFI